MPLKVWHLISNRWFSAITAYGINTSRALNTRGYVSHLTVLSNSPAEKHAKRYGVEFSTVKSFGLLHFRELAALFKLVKPDHIIVYGGPEEVFARLIAIISPATIIRFRGSSSKIKSYSIFSSLSSWGLDAYLAPNNAIKNAISRRIGHKKPVFTVQFGVDHDVFKPCFSQVSNSKKRLNLMIFGRFDPIKGHKPFFAIFAELLRYFQDSHQSTVGFKPFLLVAGLEANLSRSQLIEEAQGFGLRDGADFEIINRKFSDPVALMQSATMGVVSSTGSEDICRVAEEFLLCGIPIFVSGCGALNETLFYNAGESYHNKNSIDAAKILHSLLVKTMKESQRDRAKRASLAFELFSLPAMGRQLRVILESKISTK